MATYITSAVLLSPQPTFEGALPEVPFNSRGKHLLCHEPEYKTLIPPARLRRMNRILKMGLATATQCINQSEVKPDAIIVGTGQGCTIDLAIFMRSCSEGVEELLSPIPFINSGHNTLAGRIAMDNQIKGYNMTYLQENTALESALTDAMMSLEEGKSNCTLVGAIDEYTQLSFDLFDLTNNWRKEDTNNLDLLKADAPGTIMGEGAAFFCISNQPTDNSIEIVLSESRLNIGADDTLDWIIKILGNNHLTSNEIDLLIVGRNGDQRHDDALNAPVEQHFQQATIATYKHLCGEYPTAQAFALWMATTTLKGQELPNYCIKRKGTRIPKTILLYNKSERNTESIIVVRK
ncbi:MAG: beta-ketoacyl synthase chain length factor [Paludibacteraceae bacterium]|nr:beta-ketoacyl synthase chain length factor [Paludibacteraceae bacterium]